jgi:arylsulfatase A-like enzyme
VPVGTDDGVAQLQDVLPTLLELAGLATPTVDGVSLLTGERPDAASGMSGTALHVRLTKYLRSGRAHKRNCLNGPVYSLCSDGFFDHTSDPALSTDLTGTLPEQEAALAAAASLWPAERARQLTARGPDHTLVAHPTLSGYDLRLYANTDLDTPVDDPAKLEQLRPWLPSPPEGSPVPASNEAALRALGYIE